MLPALDQALKRGDLAQALALWQGLKTQDPHHPALPLYRAHLYLAKGDREKAESLYRQILQRAPLPQMLTQARQGLDRIDRQIKEERQAAIAEALTEETNQQPGVLVLDRIPPEQKRAIAPAFARIIETDPYSARLQLPSRGWRLFRTGPLGRLRVYGEELQGVGVPCFTQAIPPLQDLTVRRIHHFTRVRPEPEVVLYHEETETLEPFTFQWSEVDRYVPGMVPLFEESFDFEIAKRHLFRKTKILDYAQLCDLHLGDRRLILRLCDQYYHFTEGFQFAPLMAGEHRLEASSLRRCWNQLLVFLQERFPEGTIAGDFEPFAVTAMDFEELLKHIEPKLALFRRPEHAQTRWDPAFELYSRLWFYRLFSNISSG